MLMNPQINPTSTPTPSCESVCWRRTILLDPTAPAMTIVRHSHHVGSNENRNEKASNAPITPPAAAEWVLILNKMYIIVHTSCMASAPTSIPFMKCGMRIRVITYKQQP